MPNTTAPRPIAQLAVDAAVAAGASVTYNAVGEVRTVGWSGIERERANDILRDLYGWGR